MKGLHRHIYLSTGWGITDFQTGSKYNVQSRQKNSSSPALHRQQPHHWASGFDTFWVWCWMHQESVFSLSLLRFTEEAEGLHLANNSQHGLAGMWLVRRLFVYCNISVLSQSFWSKYQLTSHCFHHVLFVFCIYLCKHCWCLCIILVT